jgi:peptidoglycan-N-acetylglucosamine deacetylase
MIKQFHYAGLLFFLISAWFVSPAPAADRFLYLTFDDGPLAGTDDCLAVCEAKGVKATFLMVGAHMTTDFRKAQVKAVKDKAMVQGNHSFSHWHQASNYADNGKTNAEWQADFKKCSDKIAEILGTSGAEFKLARLPGKNAWRVGKLDKDDGNSKRVADHLKAQGYSLFGWDVEWKFTGTAEDSDPKETPQEIVDQVKAAFSRGGSASANKVVLLMHDHQFRSSRRNKVKLEQLIDKLKTADDTLRFRTLDTYGSD